MDFFAASSTFNKKNPLLNIDILKGLTIDRFPPKHRNCVVCLLIIVLKKKITNWPTPSSTGYLLNTSGFMVLFRFQNFQKSPRPHEKRDKNFKVLLKDIKDVPWVCLAVCLRCLVLLFCLQFTCLQFGTKSSRNFSIVSCTYCGFLYV